MAELKTKENFEIKFKDKTAMKTKNHLKKAKQISMYRASNKIEKSLKTNDVSERTDSDLTIFDSTGSAIVNRGGNYAKKAIFSPLNLSKKLGVYGVDKNIFKKQLNKKITTKTAFSPIETRREMYNKSYRRASAINFFRNYKNTKNRFSVVSRSALNPIEKAYNVIVEIVKTSGSIGKHVLINIVAAALPLIILSVAVLFIAAFIMGATHAVNVINITGTVRLNNSLAYLTINKDGSDLTTENDDGVLYKGKAVYRSGQFIMKETDTYIKGKSTRKQFTVIGKLKGEEIALKGTLNGNIVKLEGFKGADAATFLYNNWLNPYGKTKYIITSGFGNREHPVTGEWTSHSGWDLCSIKGTNSPIYATAKGTVIHASEYGGYGNCVIIDNGKDIVTLYGHLNSILVSQGTKIKAGQLIGLEGSTGVSTGSHLHFEVRKGGIAVDGAKYLISLYANAINGKDWK